MTRKAFKIGKGKTKGRNAGKNHSFRKNRIQNQTQKGGIVWNNINITQYGHVKIKIPFTLLYNPTDASITNLFNPALRDLRIYGLTPEMFNRKADDLSNKYVSFYSISFGKTKEAIFGKNGALVGTGGLGFIFSFILSSVASASVAAAGVLAGPVGWALIAGFGATAITTTAIYGETDLRNDKLNYRIKPTYSVIDSNVLKMFAKQNVVCCSACKIRKTDGGYEIKRVTHNYKINNKTGEPQLTFYSNRSSSDGIETIEQEYKNYKFIVFKIVSFSNAISSSSHTRRDFLSGVSKNRWKIEIIQMYNIEMNNADLIADLEQDVKFTINSITESGNVLTSNIDSGTIDSDGVKKILTLREKEALKKQQKTQGELNLILEKKLYSIKTDIAEQARLSAKHTQLGFLINRKIGTIIENCKQNDKKLIKYKLVKDMALEAKGTNKIISMSDAYDHQEFWYNLIPYVPEGVKSSNGMELRDDILKYTPSAKFLSRNTTEVPRDFDFPQIEANKNGFDFPKGDVMEDDSDEEDHRKPEALPNTGPRGQTPGFNPEFGVTYNKDDLPDYVGQNLRIKRLPERSLSMVTQTTDDQFRDPRGFSEGSDLTPRIPHGASYESGSRLGQRRGAIVSRSTSPSPSNFALGKQSILDKNSREGSTSPSSFTMSQENASSIRRAEIAKLSQRAKNSNNSTRSKR